MKQKALYLTDLNSTHGTFVNNSRIASNVPKLLSSRDLVTFGNNVEHHACESLAIPGLH